VLFQDPRAARLPRPFSRPLQTFPLPSDATEPLKRHR
jgi:hypothetical protein